MLDGILLILLNVYVEDIQLSGNDSFTLEKVISQSSNRFTIHTESVNKFLGITIEETAEAVKLRHASMI